MQQEMSVLPVILIVNYALLPQQIAPNVKLASIYINQLVILIVPAITLNKIQIIHANNVMNLVIVAQEIL